MLRTQRQESVKEEKNLEWIVDIEANEAKRELRAKIVAQASSINKRFIVSNAKLDL